MVWSVYLDETLGGFRLVCHSGVFGSEVGLQSLCDCCPSSSLVRASLDFNQVCQVLVVLTGVFATLLSSLSDKIGLLNRSLCHARK